MNTWYKELHWQIIIGLVLGLLFGLLASIMGWGEFTSNYIKPFGTIFINLLKLIAVPLVLASLVVGVTSLNDMAKLSRMGLKTILIYMVTTVFAITIGLTIVNVMEPGNTLPVETQQELMSSYSQNIESSSQSATQVMQRRPLDFVVDIVPQNIVQAMSDNSNMLQVVFIAIFFGVGLLMIPAAKARPLVDFFDGLTVLVIKLVEIIMLLAPIGVFALIAGTITSIAGDNPEELLDLLGALGLYGLTVVAGLAVMILFVYPLLLKLFTKRSPFSFFQGIAPAQLVAFSTSSSGATLPVTMECAEKNLGVSEEVSSFVLPRDHLYRRARLHRHRRRAERGHRHARRDPGADPDPCRRHRPHHRRRPAARHAAHGHQRDERFHGRRGDRTHRGRAPPRP